MAVEWYYLENDTEIGPVSGKQLKSLVEARNVLPRTPLRRVSSSDQSPWTRAGAVKELFPGDVADQLGGVICDDCGTVLNDGDCPECNKLGESFASQEEPPPPPFISSPSESPKERKISLGKMRDNPKYQEHAGKVKTIARNYISKASKGALPLIVIALLATLVWQQYKMLELLGSGIVVSTFGSPPLSVDVTNRTLDVDVTNSKLDVDVTNSKLDVRVYDHYILSGEPIPVKITNSELDVEVTNSELGVRVNNSELDVEVTNHRRKPVPVKITN